MFFYKIAIVQDNDSYTNKIFLMAAFRYSGNRLAPYNIKKKEKYGVKTSKYMSVHSVILYSL